MERIRGGVLVVEKLNLPSISVSPPIVVPLITTVAPNSASFVLASLIIPDTVCAFSI